MQCKIYETEVIYNSCSHLQDFNMFSFVLGSFSVALSEWYLSTEMLFMIPLVYVRIPSLRSWMLCRAQTLEQKSLMKGGAVVSLTL